MMEFVLASLALTPLALGTTAIGLGLTRYMQVSSVCRSAASMFVRGADFTQPGYQRILAKIAEGLGIADSSGNIVTTGNGVVIFTVAMRVGDADCTSLGYGPGDGRCTNRYKTVVTRRVVVGNSSLRTSAYGTPSGGTQSAEGSYTANFYLLNPTAVVAAFGTAADDQGNVSSAPAHLAAGEVSYIAEAFFTAPEINLFPSVFNLEGYYQRSFF